jgi:transcriptional regulator with XRE-family HTH domain
MKTTDLRKTIDLIAKERKMKYQDIAVNSNINRSYMSELMNSTANKSVSKQIMRKLTDAFPNYFETSPETNSSDPTKTTPIELNEKVLSLSAIHNLTIANKEMAESNNKLANGHVELIGMLKNSIAESQLESRAASPAMNPQILELLAQIGSGKKPWKSVEEGLAVISSKLHADLSKKKVVGTQKN